MGKRTFPTSGLALDVAVIDTLNQTAHADDGTSDRTKITNLENAAECSDIQRVYTTRAACSWTKIFNFVKISKQTSSSCFKHFLHCIDDT